MVENKISRAKALDFIFYSSMSAIGFISAVSVVLKWLTPLPLGWRERWGAPSASHARARTLSLFLGCGGGGGSGGGSIPSAEKDVFLPGSPL